MMKSLVTALLAILPLALFGCAEKRRDASASSVLSHAEREVPPRLLDAGAKHPEALASVVSVLKREGEDPAAFYANIERKADGDLLVFHLWHQSAFLPEHRGAIGNPGGKCRDIVFDVRSGKASPSAFWQ